MQISIYYDITFVFFETDCKVVENRVNIWIPKKVWSPSSDNIGTKVERVEVKRVSHSACCYFWDFIPEPRTTVILEEHRVMDITWNEDYAWLLVFIDERKKSIPIGFMENFGDKPSIRNYLNAWYQNSNIRLSIIPEHFFKPLPLNISKSVWLVLVMIKSDI